MLLDFEMSNLFCFASITGMGNHRYYLLFLSFLTMTGVWLLYGTLLCMYLRIYFNLAFKDASVWSLFFSILFPGSVIIPAQMILYFINDVVL